MISWPFKRIIYERFGDTKDPLMIRYYLTPKIFGFRLCVHKFLRSDYDRAYHDHPWNFISLVLKGSYIEHYPQDLHLETAPIYPYLVEQDCTIHRIAGDIIFHKKTWKHWVEVDKSCWTLILLYGKRRDWGFWQDGKFIPQKEFIDNLFKGLPG